MTASSRFLSTAMDERAPERGVTAGVSLDAAEADAVRMLQNAGLAPRLRHSAVLSLVGG